MKRISMKNKIGSRPACWNGAGLSLLTLAPNAKAQTATYASSRRQIKACVLIASKTRRFSRLTPFTNWTAERTSSRATGTLSIRWPLPPSAARAISAGSWERKRQHRRRYLLCAERAACEEYGALLGGRPQRDFRRRPAENGHCAAAGRTTNVSLTDTLSANACAACGWRRRPVD